MKGAVRPAAVFHAAVAEARLSAPETVIIDGDAAFGWDADALQLRLITDPRIPRPYPTGDQRIHGAPQLWHQKVAHMTFWYSTLEKKAAFQSGFGMRFEDQVVNPEGVKGAYRRLPGGNGYVCEYRVPWSVLTFGDNPHPRGGDVTGLQWQVHWGDAQGRHVERGMTDVRAPGSKSLGYMAPGEYGKAIFSKTGQVEPQSRPESLATAEDGHIPVGVDLPAEARRLSLGIWRNGHLVRTLAGAKPVEVGAVDPAAMRRPDSLAIGPEGRLWVCENDDILRRLSVWNADGSLHSEYFGSSSYSPFAYGDPQRPWLVEHNRLRWRVDLETAKARPERIMYRNLEGELPRGTVASRAFGFGIFIHHADRTYLWTKSNGGPVSIFEEVDGRYVLRAGIMGNRQNAFLFEDSDGDGAVAPNELRKLPELLYWSQQAGNDLSLYWPGRGPDGESGVYRLPVADISDDGLLGYAAEATFILLEEGPDQASNLAVDADDNMYLLRHRGPKIGRNEPMHGRGHYLGKWSPDGKLLWKYHNAWEAFAWNSSIYQPGQILSYIRFAGRPGRFVAISGYYGNYFPLDPANGLFVQALGQDQRGLYTMDSSLVLTENFNGFLWQPEGHDWHFLAGDADVRIWRLAGMNAIETFSQPLKVTPAQATKAKEWARRRIAALATRKLFPLEIYRAEAGAITVDGKLRDWDKVTRGRAGARIFAPSPRGGTIFAQYDDSHLYLLYQVQDETPLRNQVSDPKRLFKTGDAIDLLFAADPKASADRTKPAPGDLRILITRSHDGQMVATLYRPHADAEEKYAHLFRSPTGSEAFDEVRPIQQALALGYTDTVDGYAVEVAVPWSLLGGKAPASGSERRGDFGIIYGDPGGTRNAIKYMWADQSPEVSINNDIPHEARLYPKEWGIWHFQ